MPIDYPGQPKEPNEDPLAILEFAPHEFRRWIEKAGKATAQEQAWADYVILMMSFAEAFKRAPITEEACNAIDIIQHINYELACLTDTILLLYPNGEMGPKVYPQPLFTANIQPPDNEGGGQDAVSLSQEAQEANQAEDTSSSPTHHDR
jgi:hypothetical protein